VRLASVSNRAKVALLTIHQIRLPLGDGPFDPRNRWAIASRRRLENGLAVAAGAEMRGDLKDVAECETRSKLMLGGGNWLR
jgi:hypothetical protein